MQPSYNRYTQLHALNKPSRQLIENYVCYLKKKNNIGTKILADISVYCHNIATHK